MEVFKYSLGQLQANCYFLIKDNDCLIIDPGDEASFILEELQRRKLKLIGMLATHGHFDHVGAVGEIQMSADVPLYIFREDLFLIDRLEETAEYFLGYKPHFVKPTNIKYLQEGELKISPLRSSSFAGQANFKFQIINAPGHTPGSCCLHFKDDEVIFTGDTLFKRGIGRYDFSYSDKKLLKNSISRILSLPGKTKIYSGHGEETVVRDENKIINSL